MPRQSFQKALVLTCLPLIIALPRVGSAMDESDRDFLLRSLKSGLTEIEIVSLAATHAASTQVKAYAAQLKQDHLNLNRKLSALASEENIPDLAAIRPDESEISRLSGTSKPDFDRELLEHSIAKHKLDIAQFSSLARDTEDSSVLQLANETIPMLRENLKQVEELLKSLNEAHKD